MKVLAIITARGGSKGIPGKNIKDLGGKPLIAYTIEVAKNSQLITDLIVSTDDDDIAQVSKNFGAEVPFMRPAELAEDSTPTLPVIQHAVEFMEKAKGYTYDYLVTLQPTSPFRVAEEIDQGIRLLDETKADSSVSLVEVPSTFHPIKIKKLEGNKVLPYCLEEEEGVRRQDLAKAYRRSSAVYVNRRNLVMKDNLFYGKNIVGYVTPSDRFVDIDDLKDWAKAEEILQNLKKQGFDF